VATRKPDHKANTVNNVHLELRFVTYDQPGVPPITIASKVSQGLSEEAIRRASPVILQQAQLLVAGLLGDASSILTGTDPVPPTAQSGLGPQVQSLMDAGARGEVEVRSWDEKTSSGKSYKNIAFRCEKQS